MPLAIIFSVIAFQILFIFVHLAVYATLAAAFGIGGPALEWLFIFLSLTFTAASILAFRFRGKFVDWYYTASAYWFGLINVLFAGAVGFFITANILNDFNRYVPYELIAGIWFGAAFLLHCYATWNASRARITRVKIALPNLPPAWRGKKAVFVSDIHLGNIWGAGFARKITKKINELAPEAIFIGGDLFDGGNLDCAVLSAPLRELRARHGVYFITGNHEYYVKDVESVFAAIRGLGMRILNNEKITIEGLDVVGLEYRATHKKEDLEAVLKTILLDASRPTVVLKHEPDNLSVLAEKGFSLGLFGHTHRGQIFPLTLLTRRIYKRFDYGLKQLGNMSVFTSSGAGTWGPPMRFGTRSEIVLIEFAVLGAGDQKEF